MRGASPTVSGGRLSSPGAGVDTSGMNRFDKFCEKVSDRVSHATFFTFCVLLVIAWLIQGIVKMASEGPAAFFDSTYQLEINTTTTIITFLMVALLQNAGRQFENATNAKLNTILEALAELNDTDTDRLKRMVGAEKEIGAHADEA